ncbi:response regulator transcription factor [Methylocystis sp. JAN1]|uniref:response regulator transcription factor n=1 Tax=Methylocystis sp. JAN1 TaxID=3397211 RepID=UPI003FA29176
MPTVYVVAQDQTEREALAALLAREGRRLVLLADLLDFLGKERFAESGCVVICPPEASSVREMMMRLRTAMPDPVPVIVVAAKADVSLAVQAMKEGAADFLEKPVKDARLVASVRAAIEASRVRAERMQRKRELTARYRTLSAREKDVVDAVLGGRGNREVATQLGIKPRTVETHRSNAMTKLGARTLPDLVRIWLDLAGPAV